MKAGDLGFSMNPAIFSWSPLLDLTQAKARFSHKRPVPLTHSGRQRKFGAMCGGLVLVIGMMVVVGILVWVR